jgi:phosphonate transport system substrate-binding protein
MYRVGAVVYHPKVRDIWTEFMGWFGEQGFPIEPRYFDAYEDQLEALLAGELDTAWNTNLAYVQTIAREPHARAIAMRDTDIGWRSLLIVPEGSPAQSVEDLRGCRVGFGDADSPQAQILPAHALRAAGIDPARDFAATRLDRDLGKHGDTGGAELAQLARVRAGELDASVMSSVLWDATTRLGDTSGLRVVWESPAFHHCCFTVINEDPRHAEFARLLFAMDSADPRLCEPMELEFVNEWVAFDPSGYTDLIAAVAAGPISVGVAEEPVR